MGSSIEFIAAKDEMEIDVPPAPTIFPLILPSNNDEAVLLYPNTVDKKSKLQDAGEF
jgi:hypothetical protein